MFFYQFPGHVFANYSFLFCMQSCNCEQLLRLAIWCSMRFDSFDFARDGEVFNKWKLCTRFQRWLLLIVAVVQEVSVLGREEREAIICFSTLLIADYVAACGFIEDLGMLRNAVKSVILNGRIRNCKSDWSYYINIWRVMQTLFHWLITNHWFS